MVRWDPTINLGTLISIIVLVFGLIKIIRHMDRVEFKVDEMWSWYKDILFRNK